MGYGFGGKIPRSKRQRKGGKTKIPCTTSPGVGYRLGPVSPDSSCGGQGMRLVLHRYFITIYSHCIHEMYLFADLFSPVECTGIF